MTNPIGRRILIEKLGAGWIGCVENSNRSIDEMARPGEAVMRAFQNCRSFRKKTIAAYAPRISVALAERGAKTVKV